MTPLTSLVVVIPVNGSENGVSELVKDPIGSNVLDPVPILESPLLQNKISELYKFYCCHKCNYDNYYYDCVPIKSNAHMVLDYSNTKTAVLNSTWGIYVCLHFFFVLCRWRL